MSTIFFLSQPFALLKSRSHPNQHRFLCTKHLSIPDILVPLQLVHRPIRGMLVRQEGLRTMEFIIQYVNIGIHLTSII